MLYQKIRDKIPHVFLDLSKFLYNGKWLQKLNYCERKRKNDVCVCVCF